MAPEIFLILTYIGMSHIKIWQQNLFKFNTKWRSCHYVNADKTMSPYLKTNGGKKYKTKAYMSPGELHRSQGSLYEHQQVLKANLTSFIE